jgi:NTP pyrophosphatase (non-canonical NTP hydrolase)
MTDPETEHRHAKMRDLVMSWDELSNELIWDAYDVEGPEQQPISAERLEEFCKRFPHFELRLREFVTQWNAEEPVTDEMLAAVKVTDEEVQRSWRRTKQIIDFYQKLRDVEEQLAATKERAIGAIADRHYDWVERMGWHNKTVLEALALIASEIGEAVNECRGDVPTPAFGSELVDIILRTLDLAKWQKVDIEKEIAAKMAINEARGTRGRRI